MTYHVGLTFNLKPPLPASHLPQDYYSECDSERTIQAIARALEANGHTVTLVEATEEILTVFQSHPVEIVFNVAEGFHGTSREAQVPTLLEFLGIPYTGSGPLAMTLALDKAMAKRIFAYERIPTPKWQLFTMGDAMQRLDERLAFPLIVKPNHEGSGKGIHASSVVRTEADLRAEVRRVLDAYRQEVLVEEFIEGAEVTVAVLGNRPPRALPPLEVDFSECARSGEFFYSWRMKEYQGNAALGLVPRFHCPARLDAATRARLEAVALQAHRALGCRDLSRTDIRLSASGVPYVLEVNPLPGLDPEESNLPMIARACGISYDALIERILQAAVERQEHQEHEAIGPVGAGKEGVVEGERV